MNIKMKVIREEGCCPLSFLPSLFSSSACLSEMHIIIKGRCYQVSLDSESELDLSILPLTEANAQSTVKSRASWTNRRGQIGMTQPLRALTLHPR